MKNAPGLMHPVTFQPCCCLLRSGSDYKREELFENASCLDHVSTKQGSLAQFILHLYSGAGTIFQQGGQDQPFPAGGLGALIGPSGVRGRSPEASGFSQQSFEN